MMKKNGGDFTSRSLSIGRNVFSGAAVEVAGGDKMAMTCFLTSLLLLLIIASSRNDRSEVLRFFSSVNIT